MTRRAVNDVELYYDLSGDGEPLVLVHGTYTDHATWRFVAPDLARSFRVLTYDRRGHSRSDRPPGQGSRRTDEDDLAALIEELALGRVHLVGNSYGASISLGLASRRPDLVRTVFAHEPPLIEAVPLGARARGTVDRTLATMHEVAVEVRRGNHAGATERFVEEVALGAGMWPTLPVESQRALIANAPTFVDLLGDPAWAAVPPPSTAGTPILLTDGDRSPSWFGAVTAELTATTYRRAARHTFRGGGHAPHLTHPDEYVAVIGAFTEAGRADAAFAARVAP